MALPTFLGIGVQRAATTWLHDCLAEHPEVHLPPQKELHFFNTHFDRGLAWYEAQFAGSEGKKAIGEITPLYLHTAPLERIQAVCPQAKLIVILRSPVERTYSSYQLLEQQFFAGQSFAEALDSSRGQAVIGYSLYAAKLRELFNVFPRENVLVEIYDDVCRQPHPLFTRVCEHIDIDPHFVPRHLQMISNRIILPKLQSTLQGMGLGRAVELVKKTPLGPAIKRLSKQQQVRVDSTPEMKVVRGRLGELFRDDICACEKMLDRDLSHWL